MNYMLGKLFIFGGQDGEEFYDDLHSIILDLPDEPRITWQTRSHNKDGSHKPGARTNHTAVVSDDCLYVYVRRARSRISLILTKDLLVLMGLNASTTCGSTNPGPIPGKKLNAWDLLPRRAKVTPQQ